MATYKASFKWYSGDQSEIWTYLDFEWSRIGWFPNGPYSNHLNTGVVCYSNGIFVLSCQIVRYSNGSLKTRLKKPVYAPKCQVLEWSPKSHDFTIWKPDNHTVQYSDESGIQVLFIQMVTVFQMGFENWPIFSPSCIYRWKFRLFSEASN